MAVRRGEVTAARVAVFALGAAVAAAQDGAASRAAALRDVFERMIVADDAEADARAATLAAESPEILASLAGPTSASRSAARVRRVDVVGSSPPLGGVLVLPRSAPPSAGYPLVVATVGVQAGPEEFEIRGRFGAFLEAGAAVLAPFEATRWNARAEPLDEPFGLRAERLMPLLAATSRAAPVDGTRRVLLRGFACPRFYGPETVLVGGAFAAHAFAIAGDDEAPTPAEFAGLAPRRVVVAHGPRLGDVGRLHLRALAADSLVGAVLRVVETDALEHATTARLDATFAEAVLRDLPPNAAPTAWEAAVDAEDPRGPAATWTTLLGGRLRARVAGFGGPRPTVSVAQFVAEDAATLFVPRFAEGVAWATPGAWRSDAEAPPTVAVDGVAARVVPPTDARDRLMAFRAALRSGLPVASVARLRLARNP